jgi:protein-S-isoprenylcysteine O-methyltransferase Ste14
MHWHDLGKAEFADRAEVDIRHLRLRVPGASSNAMGRCRSAIDAQARPRQRSPRLAGGSSSMSDHGRIAAFGDTATGTVSPVTDLPLAAWALVEVGVRVREHVQGKGRADRDRGTRAVIAMTLGAAIVAALGARSLAPELRMPALLRIVGVVVMWLGLALRVWAIVALGGGFRTTVEVEPGQAVVSSGPYRWIRHPSYTGLLLIVAGFGAALGNWLSLAACVVLPLPVILWRIRVEEAELNRVLGQAYRTYQSDRARLIPGLW